MVKDFARAPLNVLTATNDFFGNELNTSTSTVLKLREAPHDSDLQPFADMVTACLNAIVTVLERQYKRYFQLDITAELKMQTQSARSHNIDAEEIIGMFSAAKSRAPNATLCYLSSRMRAQRNRAVNYLDGMDTARRDKKTHHLVSFHSAKTKAA